MALTGPMLVGAAANQPRKAGLGRGLFRHRQTDTGELEPVPGEDAVDEEELRYAPASAAHATRCCAGSPWLLIPLLVLGGLAAWGYDWSQKQYYVAADGPYVAVYRGVQLDLPGIDLSSLDETSTVRIEELSEFNQQKVERRHRRRQPRRCAAHPGEPRRHRPRVEETARRSRPRPSGTARSPGPPTTRRPPRTPALPTTRPRRAPPPRTARTAREGPPRERRPPGRGSGPPEQARRRAAARVGGARRRHRRVRRGGARREGGGAGRHRRLRRLARGPRAGSPRRRALHRPLRRPGPAAGGHRPQRARPGDDLPDRPGLQHLAVVQAADVDHPRGGVLRRWSSSCSRTTAACRRSPTPRASPRSSCC